MLKKILLSALAIGLVACSCGQKTQKTVVEMPKYTQVSPMFDADSAYSFVQKQVDFGPRVPNTKEHEACGDYLVAKLKSYGAKVEEQKALLTAFDGTKLKSRNIIASYGDNPNNIVLLFAHWDTRPFADQDAKKENWNKPILGANDGGSGVGVLLEVARQLQKQQPKIQVDIIFFDSEDYGPPAHLEKEGSNDWWCLGSQYWGKNPHIAGYKARYGILLDMVGGKDATFGREGVSMHFAKDIVEKAWSTGRKLGYGKYFVSRNVGMLTDDHTYVNQLRAIPSIDIIEFGEKGFGDFWHTQNDDMSIISKESLKAVGQTVLEVLYTEKEI